MTDHPAQVRAIADHLDNHYESFDMDRRRRVAEHLRAAATRMEQLEQERDELVDAYAPPAAPLLGQAWVTQVTSDERSDSPDVIGAPVERPDELVRFALDSAIAALGEDGCACQSEEPCALCLCREAVAQLAELAPPAAPAPPLPRTPEEG